MNPLTDTIRRSIGEFREKWGRFYYDDESGMDWKKPRGENITDCIASDDIERDIKSTQLALLKAVEEWAKRKKKYVEAGYEDDKYEQSEIDGYNQALDDLLSLLRQAREELV